ncbi:hypothetical protein WH47_07388 [Habropoda laboriosa]|uniref:Uncharacterized protein n=1 Tax=Habropoda laboriosa TaxID=597456 RepID=A0A0L7R659_9HYME|nr:PREDICTED: uncharacterized protein LOC108571499 [Habropoda laboriosa]KOC66319.1 hypothetical protein WH47_07388 [Habropoda laboriosa]
MAISATWIRNNMLLTCDQYKLSIPEWYLNKRSNPPKILNVQPFESRPPSWKSVSRYDYTLNSTSNLSERKNNNIAETTTTVDKSSRLQKSPETRHKRSPSKSSTKKEAFDTTIPRVKLSTNISKTFPKVSPSRKIQNINLVFPPGPKLDLNNYKNTEDSKYNTFVLKKKPTDTDKKINNNSSKNNATSKKRNDNLEISDIVTTPLRTPNLKANFKMRAASTPKFSPANFFSSTIIEESPKIKKIPSESILEKSFIFESSSKSNLSDSFMDKSESAPKQRKISQNLLEKTFIFENSSRMDQSCQSCDETPAKINKTNWLLERNIRLIEPLLFEKDDTALSPLKSSSVVRDIVKRIEVSKNPLNTPKKNRISVQDIKKINVEPNNLVTTIQERKFQFESMCPPFLLQQKQMNQKSLSPYTRFLNSKRKSTDLENVVRSKQPPKEKSVIQGLIETLTAKLSKSCLSQQSESMKINQNFVKKVVNALEKGDSSGIEDLTLTRKTFMNEEDSSSESEIKSCTTSASLKDTDSSTDSEQISPNLRSDEDNTFNDDTLEIKQVLKADQKTLQDDDSVYWIPVSRCKLPRTSSLLSMMSRLSSNGQSPCVSPIRSEYEVDNSPKAAWGATFQRNTGLARKLFRIDETTVIDSGYSDKSEKSGVSSGSSIVDSTWSEDTQNDSGSEIVAARMKRSSRRKSIIGQTYVF